MQRFFEDPVEDEVAEFNELIKYADQQVITDRFKLDECCERNAVHIQYYGLLLASAQRIKEALSREVKKIRARVELEYRRNPPEGLKVTDNTITALVETDKGVSEAEARLAWAVERVSVLTPIVASFEARRSDLKNLTSLWIGGYYATIGDGSVEVQDSSESEYTVMRQRLNRSKLLQDMD